MSATWKCKKCGTIWNTPQRRNTCVACVNDAMCGGPLVKVEEPPEFTPEQIQEMRLDYAAWKAEREKSRPDMTQYIPLAERDDLLRGIKRLKLRGDKARMQVATLTARQDELLTSLQAERDRRDLLVEDVRLLRAELVGVRAAAGVTETDDLIPAIQALRRQVSALTAERERLRSAIRLVVDAFAQDEAQGYRSRSRQFALDILARQIQEPTQ